MLLSLIRKLWPPEKRLILVSLLLFLLILIGRSHALGSTGEKPTFNAKLIAAQAKIKGEANWVPSGWGSGEYLADIPTIRAGAVIDEDSGNVIWSMNLKQKIAPASLTKLATVMTALDIASPSDKVKVSENAASQIPTRLGLSAGEKLTLGEAISAAILTSANDATEAIADSLGSELDGDSSTFMELVNKKLSKIGASDSHFVTPTGLDAENHRTTVYDLAIMAHEAKVDYPFIADLGATEHRRLDANSDHKQFDLPNWNALLGTYPGVDGLKIGYTDDAGHTTIVTAQRSGKKLMVIVIGAQSLEDREKAAATLLNYGFGKAGIDPYPVDQLQLVRRFEDWKKELSGEVQDDSQKSGGAKAEIPK